jgi:hypothetical protein
MDATPTLKDRLTAEMSGDATWDVHEIGRQLGCRERMVHYHFRNGLKSKRVDGRRRAAPADVEQYLREYLGRDAGRAAA